MIFSRCLFTFTFTGILIMMATTNVQSPLAAQKLDNTSYA